MSYKIDILANALQKQNITFNLKSANDTIEYENIIWFESDGTDVLVESASKPITKEQCDTYYNDELSLFNSLEYSRNREKAYPSIQEQLDMQYWDSVNGTTTWKDAIAKVKSDNPKG
tara:strand:+ start:743 stop:1093 length:351 start_codon:yes stop_codon:yes gene_type:complete